LTQMIALEMPPLRSAFFVPNCHTFKIECKGTKI
jgi:hypothetical protein